MFKKRSVKKIDVVYKGVDLHVEYKIANDSFDHEFGTEHLIVVPDVNVVLIIIASL